MGFARNEMSSEQFRDMIGKEIGEFATTKVDPDLWHWFARRIYYISGDFDDPKVYEELSPAAGRSGQGARHARQLLLLSGHVARTFSRYRGQTAGRGRSGEGRPRLAARDHREAVRPRLRIGAQRSTKRSARSWTKSRSTASTITWARKPFRTSWCSVSRTASSSRSGTAATSIISRSRWPKPWAWSSAAGITTRPERCATWCPTTSSSSSR